MIKVYSSYLGGLESSAVSGGSTTLTRLSRSRTGSSERISFFWRVNESLGTGEYLPDLKEPHHPNPRWSEIAKLLPGRAENTVKNRWNSSTYKRWLQENSHSPGPDLSTFDLSSTQGSVVAFQHLEEALAAAGVGLDPEVEAIVRKATSDSEGRGSRKSFESKTSPPAEVQEESTVSKTGIPEHLRPSSIKIRSSEGGDESSPGQIAEILSLLRSNTNKNQMLKQVLTDRMALTSLRSSRPIPVRWRACKWRSLRPQEVLLLRRRICQRVKRVSFPRSGDDLEVIESR